MTIVKKLYLNNDVEKEQLIEFLEVYNNVFKSGKSKTKDEELIIKNLISDVSTEIAKFEEKVEEEPEKVDEAKKIEKILTDVEKLD